jgi:Cys-tRNA(Pro)/Cys-tRNA(Cys) deacylase
MGTKGTPAVQAAAKAGIAHRLLTYDYDPPPMPLGSRPPRPWVSDPAVVFKTLIVELDTGALVCALIPAGARLDLKALPHQGKGPAGAAVRGGVSGSGGATA